MKWILRSVYIFGILLSLTSCVSSSKKIESAHFSNAQYVFEHREALLNQYLNLLQKYDAEFALPQPGTLENIKKEMKLSRNLEDMGVVFKKVDAAFENLKSPLELNPDLEGKHHNQRSLFGIFISPEITHLQQTSFKYHIALVHKKLWQTEQMPQVGDELISVNGLAVDRLVEMNRQVCKLKTDVQCALELSENLRSELLNWRWGQKLKISVLRKNQKLDFEVPIVVKELKDYEREDRPIELQSEVYPCGIDLKNHYYGFGFVYIGRNACILESHEKPGVVILRISSFNYSANNQLIQNVKAEVEQLQSKYWNDHVHQIKQLVIDVMDNEGGEAPIPYYALLFSRIFQEHYIRYKKIPEWSQPEFVEDYFSEEHDGGKSIWFRSIQQDESFAKVANFSLLKPIPKYCVHPKLDCREGFFEPLIYDKKKTFQAPIKIMLNQLCQGTCTGFVYNIKRYLKDRVRVYGLPDSGDNTYARAHLKLYLDENSKTGFSYKLVSSHADTMSIENNLILTQVLPITQTTDYRGQSLSNKPQDVEHFVPLSYKNYPNGYYMSVFKSLFE